MFFCLSFFAVVCLFVFEHSCPFVTVNVFCFWWSLTDDFIFNTNFHASTLAELFHLHLSLEGIYFQKSFPAVVKEGKLCGGSTR